MILPVPVDGPHMIRYQAKTAREQGPGPAACAK